MIRFGRVVAVHPSRHTVDLVDQETGWPLAECKVIGDGSSDSGSWKIPKVDPPSTDQNAPAPPPTGRVLIACYSLLEGSNRGVVHGFVSPNNPQTGMTEDNRSIERHPSGAYTTTAPDGSMEMYHPSGTYFRIGTGAHQDLGSISADGTWKTESGAGAPTITLKSAAFNLTVDPSGNGTMTYTTLTLNGPITLNGDLTQTGSISLDGGMTATGDIVGAGISLDHHKHTGGNGSGALTGLPQ